MEPDRCRKVDTTKQYSRWVAFLADAFPAALRP